MTIPLKHRPDGLGEFEPNDVVPIEHGGTGSSTLLDAQNVLGITDKLDRSEYIQHFKGVFTSYAALTAAFPTASDGDYAHIDSGSGFDRMVAIWDSSDTKWVVTQANAGANTDEVPEGSQNLYFKNQRVLATILEGLVAGTNAEILPTDNVITAFQKLQAQLKSSIPVWVDAETIGTFNASNFGHATIGGLPAKLEFARIGGNLWVRGFLLHKVFGSGQILTITDKNYKIWSKGTDNAGISAVFAWLSGNSNALTLVSPSDVYNESTATSSSQWLNAPNTMAATTFHIPMQCIGKLVLP